MNEQQQSGQEQQVPDILVAEPDMLRSTSSALEDILPVQIGDERYAEFQALYYPRRNKTKGSTIERKHYFQIAEHLALVSARFNVVRSWIYLSYAESRMSSVHSDQTCQVLALNNFKVLLETASDSKIHAAARSFFEATGNGRQHIIRPSSLMKGGYEILYTGIPPSNDNMPTGNINVVDSVKTPALNANEEQAKYWIESNVDQALRESFLNAARTLTSKMLDVEVGINNCYLRNMKQVPLSEISKRFNDAVAAALQQLPDRYTKSLERSLWQVPDLPKEIVNGLGKYITAVAVREPNATCLTLKSMAVSRNKGQPVADESMGWSLDHIAMTNNMYFSMAVHIPEDIVSFITQTPIGQKPPLQSLNIWASAWTRAAFRAPRAKQGGDGRITLGTAPRYVLLPSHVPQVIERRKKLGYFTEPGRCNEDGMYVSDNGRYYYCPPQQNMDESNAKKYEEAVEEALALSYEVGSPLASQVRGTTHKLFDLQNPGYADRIRAVKANLTNYMGSMQAFSWDYNCMLSVSPSDADKLVSIPLEGSTKPDELGISDYLNMDLGKAIDVLFSSTPLILENGSRGETPKPEEYMQDLSLFTQNAAFVHFVQFYAYLMREGRVPDFADLLQAAIKELGYDKEERKEDWTTFEAGIYGMYITPEMKPHPGLNNQDVANFVKAVTAVVKTAFNEAQAKPRTKLLNYIISKAIQNPDDTGRYIGGEAKLQDLRHLYAYVGGNIFRQMMLAIKKLDPKLLFKPIELKDQELPISMRWICQEIMPIVTIFGKYVPDHERINAVAEDIAKTTVQDLSVTPDDVQIPGSRDGFQMFPHQMGTMQYLMGHPRFAFLDIAPGGGKCLVGDSLVPSSLGILTLEEMWGLSDPNTHVRGFQDLRARVVSHERKLEYTDRAYQTRGKTHRVELSDGVWIQGLPEHKLWALQAGGLDCEFVRLDDLNTSYWVPKAVGDQIYPTKTPVLDFWGTRRKLSEELAEILGWLVSEGYSPVGEGHGTLHFEQHDAEMRDRFQALCHSEFGRECTSIRGNAVTSVGFPDTEVRKFLRSLMALGTSAFKEVPLCIRTAPKTYQVAFLRSLFEGDGTVYHANKGNGARRVWTVEYCSISEKLAQQVKMMLENMGIPVSLQVGRKYYSNGHEHAKRVCTIRINYRYIPKFQEEIGFISDRKAELLSRAASHTDWMLNESKQSTNIEAGGSFNRIPALAVTQWLLQRIESTLAGFEYDVPPNSKGGGGRIETWSLQKVLRDNDGFGNSANPARYSHGATNRYSVKRVLRIIDALEPMIRKALYADPKVVQVRKKLETMLEQYWVHVERSRKGTVKTVFDLSVPGPHSYSVGGVYGHNTTLGLSELAMLVGKKLIKRPVVFAPNNLVKNWVEDMHKHTEGRWNVIPITTSIYNTWGEERLTKLITNAPRNTVVVVSNSVLRLRKFTVVIGNYVSMLSATLEFVRKFGFDYVLLDESHRNRNKRTTVHRAVKMLCTMTSVKFVRQATGTMIHNKLTDVVGQASLFSGQIFRTPEEYEAENSERIGDTKVLTWKKDTPKRARAQLARYSAVISYKRKEWAFMLPIPIETFIPVSLDNNVDSEGGAAHKLMYQAILTETLDEIRHNERVKKLLSGVNDDDEDEDDENGNAGLAKAAGADALAVGGVEKALSASEDLDDETLAELEAELEPYLQRLEQMLTDPIGDPFGEIYFKGINREGFVSSKVRKIIDRIKLNFIDFPWKTGGVYKPRDIVDHKDVRYTLLPAGEDDRAEYQSTTPPDQDKRWKVEARGKVIVFCRYIRTVNAIYRALPPDLKKLAVKFHGEIPDRQNNLDLFKSTPYSKDKGIQILIANEMSISEGQNLQMASRLIRVEAPWAPGELDQSMSRIFRPDVSGVFARESIFLDWILCNSTLEVAKMGRLISKMLTKAQFDEADNPLYDGLNSGQLPLIRMSMEMIASVPMLDDIMDYIDEYRNLVSIQSSEFKEMRSKHKAKMIPIPATPMFEDAKILEQVPYLPNMEVPDRHGLGLVKLLDFLQDTDNPDAVMAMSSKDGLIGKPVHTEFGNGVISNVGYSRVKGENGTEDLRRITRIDVKLINTDETYSAAPSMIHLVSNPKADVALLKATSPKEKVATKADKIKAERAAEKARQLEIRESRRAERQRERETKQLERLRAVENKVKNKRELVLEDGNIKVYKLNDDQYYATDKEYRVDIEKVEGVWTLAHEGEELEANPRTSKAAIKAAVDWINAQHEEPAEEENNNIELFPVVYNGFLALEATPEDEDIDMSAYGFKEFGPYAYCQIKDRISYDALLKFLYSKFEIPAKSREQLEAFNEAFVSGRGRKFDVELAPVADLPKFHMLRHKMSQINKVSKKPELRIYPVVMNGALLMNVNISTNPAIRKYLNKPIPGTRNVKFQEADGLSIKFYQSRSELQADVKKLVNEGFEITNADELKSEIAALKTKRK